MSAFQYLARKIVSVAFLLSGSCAPDTSRLLKEYLKEDAGVVRKDTVVSHDAAVFYDAYNAEIRDANYDRLAYLADQGIDDGKSGLADSALPDISIPPDAATDTTTAADAAFPFDAGHLADGAPDSSETIPADSGTNDAMLFPADAGTDASADTDASDGSLTPFEQNLSLLEEKLRTLRWVSFAPTNFNPLVGLYPSSTSIEEDLRVLYQHGFRGIITYGSENSLQYVPSLAKEVGFESVLMGVWLPESSQLDNAEAEQEFVEGYGVGNENLGISYSLDELVQATRQLRSETNKPVTTTEQGADYFGEQAEQLIAMSDFIFPNVHPYWAGITAPAAAAQWTAGRYQAFTESVPPEKVVFFKEVGLPSAGCGACSEENQRDYYQLLGGSEILFSYFEAFDQPWKDWAPVEPNWGLFYADRSPKLIVSLFE